MELQHNTSGCRIVGVAKEETPSSWHLRPVEYAVDANGTPRYATSPEGVWLPKAKWNKVV